MHSPPAKAVRLSAEKPGLVRDPRIRLPATRGDRKPLTPALAIRKVQALRFGVSSTLAFASTPAY